MSDRTHRLLAFSALLIVGSLLLFVRLGNGPFEVWDEGLYGNYARNALHSHQYLHAVDERGGWPQHITFSKPPLSLWLVALSFHYFGPTTWALRLPFAAACLAVSLLMFAWGCRLQEGKRGSWLGFAWGACWLVSHAAYHWGRTANIEPLLISFVMATLYCYARALDRTPRQLTWAALSGLGLLLAFLTKQVVCALALLPILALELRRLGPDGFGAVLRRLSVTLALPLVGVVAWVALLWRSVGKQAWQRLWQYGVVSRFNGFESGQHKNYLNRAAEQLTKDAPPLSWQVGMVAFFLLLSHLARRRERSQDAWLLGGLLVVAWLSFDVGSRSLLPWYILNLLPAIALGCAWAITHAVNQALAGSTQLDGMSAAAAGLGVAVMAEWAVLQSKGVISSIFAAGAVAAVAALLATRVELRKWLFGTALTAWLVLTVAGFYRRDGYHDTEPYPVARLGDALYRAGARRISVDERMKLAHVTQGTFFGAESAASAAPWTLTDHRFDARVEQVVIPREARVAAKRLFRAPGLSAFMGALRKPPFSAETLLPALEKGVLTFEAEDLASDRYDTLRSDERASAGRYRSYVPRDGAGSKPKAHVLAKGLTSTLPAGTYDAAFYLRTACAASAKKKAPAGRVGTERTEGRGAASSVVVTCDQAQKPDASFVPVTVTFSLSRPRGVELFVREVQGEIAVDRITLRKHL